MSYYCYDCSKEVTGTHACSTTTPKPTLDERRVTIDYRSLLERADALKRTGKEIELLYIEGAIKLLNKEMAAIAEMQAEHKEHMREQFADLVKRQRELQEENKNLREALERIKSGHTLPLVKMSAKEMIEYCLKKDQEMARKALEGK
jgi:hypothetical protein